MNFQMLGQEPLRSEIRMLGKERGGNSAEGLKGSSRAKQICQFKTSYMQIFRPSRT